MKQVPPVWPAPDVGAISGSDWELVGPDLDGGTGDAASASGNRSSNKVRTAYLQRLACERVWVPRTQRAPRYQTIIVLDWDDTLLCTSYLGIENPRQQHLQRLANTAQKLIELARTLGHTCIITNAQGGWVEQSARKHMPSLLPTLQEISVVSARERYEARFPQPKDWKLQAFLALREEVYTGTIMNILSIGDSCFELDAAHLLGKSSKRAVVKTIKLQESPSPTQLEKELQEVMQRLPYLAESGRSIDATLRWRQRDS